jgi:hypothetical protein
MTATVVAVELTTQAAMGLINTAATLVPAQVPVPVQAPVQIQVQDTATGNRISVIGTTKQGAAGEPTTRAAVEAVAVVHITHQT